MITLETLASDEQIKSEYKKALMLNMFKKTVSKMNNDSVYKSKIHKLFLESTDREETVKILIRRNFDCELTLPESQTVLKWFNAYFTKQNKRKQIPAELKIKLCLSQSRKCAVCGECLGNDLSKIHVDHIIPWALVGDELENNYQALCETCNECKSAHTDYIFKKLIKLA